MSRHHTWLARQITQWLEEGLVTEPVAATLRARYPSGEGEDGGKRAAVVFSLFGGLLIGAGIIALLAFNWASLDRAGRAIVGIAALLAAQGLTAWMIRSGKNRSPAWREGAGAFFVAALGACLGIITQTYHLSGSAGGFVLLWSLLMLPVIYLLRSFTAALLYLAGITAWSVMASHWQDALGYLPLLAAALPFGIAEFRAAGRLTPGLTVLTWALGLSFPIALLRVLTGEGANELGVLLVLELLACVYVFVSHRINAGETSMGRRPLLFLGSATIFVLAFVFTSYDAWKDLSAAATGRAWAVVAVLLLVTGWLAYELAQRRRWPPLAYLGLPLLTLLWLLAAPADTAGFAAAGAFLGNAYVIGLGLLNIFHGTSTRNFGRVNLGVALLAALTLFRFFDSGLPLLVKGVAFILIGAGFLALNITLIRRRAPSA